MARINERLRELEKEISDLKRTAKTIERLGDDSDYPMFSVIVWTRKFNQNKTTYHYAAIKCPPGWYTTDQDNGSPYSWEGLVDEHLEDAEEIWYVTVMEAI